MSTDNLLLLKNTAIYRGLINYFSEAFEGYRPEKKLAIINLVASFQWRFHAGLFVSIQLENWALSVGKSIWENNSATAPVLARVANKPAVLHVVTETYAVGGHTRLLLNIIKNDSASLHNVVLTNQKEREAPDWLHAAVEASGGAINSLWGQAKVEQVAVLQQIITKQADRIFYHIHPDDSVAVAALAATPRPQVLIINHADHTFWLGSRLADVVVCYRQGSLAFSTARRAAQRVALLPTALNFEAITPADKQAAREQLGVQAGQVVILTVASAYKFKPSDQHNYYRLLAQVVEANPQVVVKVVGVRAEESAVVGFKEHKQIELLGAIEDPKPYYKAADLYVDSMPFSSFTSLFEAMYFGCFPVLQFQPSDNLIIGHEPALDGLVPHPRDEQHELQLIQRAINDVTYREETAQRGSERIQAHYMGDGWKNQLTNLYAISAAKVQVVTYPVDLNFPDKQAVDIEAAYMSTVFYGDSTMFLFRCLLEKMSCLSIKDIIGIYSSLKKQPNYGQQLTLRQVLYFVRRKLTK